MTDTQTPASSAYVNTNSSIGYVTLARLVRLRRDDATHQPSRIYAQIVGEKPEGGVAAVGQAELFQNGDHVLVPAEAWSSGEMVLESLLAKEVALSDASQAHAFLDSLMTAAEPTLEEPPSKSFRHARDAIFRAIREAYLIFCVGYSSGEDEFARLLDTKINQVSRYFVAPPPAAPNYNGAPANTFNDAPYIEPLPKDGTKGHLLEREALRYGMSSTRYPNGAFVVTDPTSQRQLGFKWGRSPLASGTALSICSYKEATRRLLKRVDVPVPNGRVFSASDWDLAVQYADRIGYPVVCKPVAGLRGIGVIANIQNRAELENALKLYQHSELGDDDFVIEEHVPGEDYRIVVIGDQVVASVVRAPASVTGDGRHTVADLIEYKNRARRENPHLSSRLITLSESLEYQLALQDLTYSSVPAPQRVVTLANSANLSQGGDSFEIADDMHASIKELSVKAVQAVPGLGFCGLDMLIEDHTKPVWEQRVTVIELNAHAAIGSAQYPMWGAPAPVAKKFFEATSAGAEIQLPKEQSDRLSLKFNVRGRVTGVNYLGWFGRQAADFGLTGYVKSVGRGHVEAHVSGDADAVSALGYLAVQGPSRALPSSVVLQPAPLEHEHFDGFRVITRSRPSRLVRKAVRGLAAARRRARKALFSGATDQDL